MHSFFMGLRLLFALVLTACSGGREDQVDGECVTDRQCSTGEQCVSGACRASSTGGPSTGEVPKGGKAKATGQVAGAPSEVRLETRGNNGACEDRGEQGIVCQLGADEGLTLIAPAAEGFRFTHWSGSEGCAGEQPELALKGLKKDVACTANYVKRVHVSGMVAGEGVAQIAASSESPFARCEFGSCEVDVGSEVLLLAPARDGFRLTGFEGEGCGPRDGYRVTVITDAQDVVCTASYIDSLTVRGQTAGLGELATQATSDVKASSSWEGAQCDGPLCGIDAGQTVVLTAPDVEGFRFRGWIGDPACLGNEPQITLANVTSNLSCTADYVARFTVRGASEGADAQVAASADNLFSACEGDHCVIDGGETVTLIASTVDGYRLSGWTGDGCEAQPGASALARAVAKDVTCTAQFVKGVSVSGTLVNAEGQVLAESSSPGANCSPGSCAIDIGGSVTLTAPNLEGRTFVGWSGGDGCTGKALTLALNDVTTSKACRATYAARYTVSAAANPTAGGSVLASATGLNVKCMTTRCEVDEGTKVTLTAKAGADYRFNGWTGGGPCLGSNEKLDVTASSTVTCTANYVLRINVSGTAAPAAAGTVQASQLSLNAVCSGAKCTVDSGSTVTLTATAGEGWRFVNWSGCGSPFNPLLALNPLPVLGPTENTVCTANFQKITYPVDAIGSNGGAASASYKGAPCAGSTCQVPHGESATLTASPDEGYDFAGWTGPCSGAVATVSNVRAAVSCTAQFTIKRVAVTARSSQTSIAAPRGDCGQSSCTVDWGSSVTLTATATLPEEYRFDGWDCRGGVSNASADVITITNVRADQTCTAKYARRYRVTVKVGPEATDGTASCVGSCFANPGASVTLVANPADFKVFWNWDCGPTDNSSKEPMHAVTLTGDLICTAIFVDMRLDP